MQDEGYTLFNTTRHTELWRAMGAKAPAKGYGAPLVADGEWGWYDKWISVVRKHCKENAARYGKAPARKAEPPPAPKLRTDGPPPAP